MTIHLLKNKEIDKSKWDAALAGSNNGLIYATAIYLDHMCPGWSALVNDDYSVLMPLTARSKLGISYLYQPPFCQQLGIFGAGAREGETRTAFAEKAMRLFSFGEIFLNHGSLFPYPAGLPQHRNYILDLSRDYATIHANYTSNLVKKSFRKLGKFSLVYTNLAEPETSIQWYRELYGARMPHLPVTAYEAFARLARKLLPGGQAFCRQVQLPNGELLATGLFLKDSRRIYNIISATLPNGRTFEANYFLYDQLVQEFAGSGLLLDFEGSDLPGVARFYEKFGPYDEPYYFLRWNRLPWPLRWFKK